jgi:hypothetical protein
MQGGERGGARVRVRCAARSGGGHFNAGSKPVWDDRFWALDPRLLHRGLPLTTRSVSATPKTSLAAPAYVCARPSARPHTSCFFSCSFKMRSSMVEPMTNLGAAAKEGVKGG